MLLGHLRVLVQADALWIRFGPLPAIRKRIPLELIESARPVRYRPIRQFGRWGIRRGRFEGKTTAVYSIRGSTGVLIALTRPIGTLFFRSDRILIGSRDPERLARALDRARSVTRRP